jgi:HEAT repeat protein
MNAILLAIVLAAPVAASKPAPSAALTDAQIHSTIAAYLGSIDTPIPAERWAELGARAEAELTSIALGAELPTRRAKAVDGLAAISPKSAPALFTRLATDESAPINVRYAAVRGLGHVTPAAKITAALQPILEQSPDIRLRAKAGEELAKRNPGEGCQVLRAQVAREATEVRAQFDRAREGCLGR